ncbi:hypothetical protein FOL47_010269, partial [Perkinsus chesapeaki]
VNTLLGKPVLKEYQLDGSNPGTYPEWRVRICDEIDNYNCSREVTAEIVWACLNSTLRLRIRRRVPRSDILHRGHVAILDVLDDIYLTPNELKAFQSRWEGIAQEPNETIPEYALRFEELAHTRRILLRADVTESELVQKFSNGFKEPIAVLAKMLVDPLASLSYEAFKQAVISFVQSGDENILRVFGALTTTTTPTPLAPMQPPNPKRLLARNAVYDTDICYVHAHAAITESLGLDRRACLRCGKNTNHFARECDSPTIFRVSDRCHTCGDLRGPSHRCRISPRRVVCSRCLQAGHVAGVCKNQRKANSGRYAEVQSAEEESHFEDKFPVTTSKCAVITAMVAAAVRKDASDPIIDFLRRLPRQPEVHLTLGDKGAYCKTSCLVDSGANCSLISSGLTTYLTKRGVICEDDVLPLPNKIPIGVASGKTIIGSHLARARFASGQLDGVLEFLVCDNVDPDILLGTNMFPAIGVQLTSTGQADTTNFRCASSTTAAPPSPVLAACALPLLPTAEVVQTAEGKRVMCHCGPLGKLTIFPYREKQRQLSKANQQILSHRLSTMADQGKIQPCAEGECTVVLAPVICDKESGAKARVYPDPSVDKRYRITVDCRPINRLVLIEAGDSNMMLLPQAMAEPSITSKLGSIPFSYQTYYKLDLTDAYSGVLLPPQLSSIFGTTSQDEDGSQLWWVYRVLPQGWIFSSCLFNSAMQVLIDIINQRLAELQIEAVCRHNKDDILIASTDPSSCKEAAAVAMEVFSEHGFHPNPTKSCGPTDRVRFCGVVLHAGGHRPEGSRQVFTESTFELAWSEFASPPIKSTKTFNGSEAVRLARLAWLRKWSGIMNYLRNHLPPDVLASLYVLQDALSRYQKDESIPLQEELVDPQNDNVTSINKAFSSLLHFYLSGVPPMVATNLGCSLLGTVILADSNADSWSAVVLRASVRNDADKDTPNSVDVPLAFPDSQYLFDTTLIEPMVLLPVHPDSAGPDPIGICADLLIGLQRCFRAWKSRVPFEQSFDAPVDPEAARRWLHDAQGQDEECDKIRLLISHKLSRFLVDGDGLIRLRDRYVIPRKYACDIARKYHHYFGHLDSKQTVACISKDFYVFGLARAVQRVISRCVCQYTRARRGTDRPVATSLQGALAPMECVFIDVVGPFPSSSKHPYRFVLSCMDAATRYVWYFALRSTTSQSLIDVLEANVVFQDLRSGISDDSVKFEADRRCKRREVQLKNVMDLLDKAEADCALRPPDSIGSNVRRQFKKGDLVLRWREAQHSLDSSWYGPFSVTDVYGDYTYRLNDGSVHDSKTLCTFHPVHH